LITSCHDEEKCRNGPVASQARTTPTAVANPIELERARRQVRPQLLEQPRVAGAVELLDHPGEAGPDPRQLLEPALPQQQVEILVQALERLRPTCVGARPERRAAGKPQPLADLPQRAADGEPAGRGGPIRRG
jgi:hypothetical protein